MDSLTILRTLYAHNYWGLERILTASASLPDTAWDAPASFPHASLWATLFHAAGAEWLWLARCQRLNPTRFLDEPEQHTLAAMRSLWQARQQTSTQLLADITPAELSQEVHFTNLSGKPLSLRLGHILLHAATHTGAHRTEAAQIITELGCSPGDLDLDDFVAATGLNR